MKSTIPFSSPHIYRIAAPSGPLGARFLSFAKCSAAKAGGEREAASNPAARLIAGLLWLAILLAGQSRAAASYVAITSPANGAAVSATVTIATNETSDVSWINVYVDGSWVASNPSNGVRPFVVSWNSTTVANGKHTISVTGYNSSSVAFVNTAIGVNVQNTGSTCLIINAPAAGAKVSGTSVALSTTDTCSGVSFESLFIDGAHVGDFSPGKVTFNSTAVSNGTHTVKVTSQSASPGTMTLGSAAESLYVQNGWTVPALSTYVQSASKGVAAVTSVSLPFPGANTSGHAIVVAAGEWCNAGTPGTLTVTDSVGNTYAPITATSRVVSTSSSSRAQTWYAKNIKAGANTVTIRNTSVCDISLSIQEYAGITSAAVWHDSTATGLSVNSGSVSASPNQLLFSFAFDQTSCNDAWTMSAGWTARQTNSNPGCEGLRTADHLTSTSGSYSNTFAVNQTSNGLHGHIVAFSNVVDTTAPTISITSPATGASYTVGKSVAVSVTASDNVGVVKTALYVDGVLNATDTASPWSFAWNTAGYTIATHTLVAKAYDAARMVGTSAPVSVKLTALSVDTTPPLVAISAPANGATVSGSVTVSVAALDNVGVVKTQLYVDSKLAATDSASPWGFTWNTSGLSGSHTLKVTAFDAAGNQGVSNPVSVTVSSTTTDGDSVVLGTKYYVATSGCNDAYSGTSKSTPWCTLSRAMNALSSLRPDDGILFRCGDSWRGQFNLKNVNGSAGHPVVIGHYSNGVACKLPHRTYSAVLPTINGASTYSLGFNADHNSNVSYLTIDGFDIHDTTLGGIMFNANGGNMPGITIENNLVHHLGKGACNGCGSPSDPNDYDYDAGIGFNDEVPGGCCTNVDGVHIIGNTVWDLGGHNTVRVHYDRSSNVLVQGNLAGPGCIHNCFDTKAINGKVVGNIATCYSPAPAITADGDPAWTSRRGDQCEPDGNGNLTAGFYTENPWGPDTYPTWIGNIAHDIGLCAQAEDGYSHPRFYNNTCYNAYYLAMYYQTCSAADVEKNLFSSVGNGQIAGAGIGTWIYNDDYGLTGEPAGTGNVSVDPQYANPSAYNYAPLNSIVNSGWSTKGLTTYSYLGALP